MLILNNTPTQDNYVDANKGNAPTLEQPGTVRLNVYVYNQPIFVQLLREDRNWSDELYLPPGERSYDRSCRGVRVKSAVAGKPANVTLELLTADDLT